MRDTSQLNITIAWCHFGVCAERWLKKMIFIVGCTVIALRIEVAWPYKGHPSYSPNSGTVGAINLPPFCSGPTQVQGVNAYVCEIPVNWVYTASELAPFASANIGVTIQAVGGRGGDGGSDLGGTVGAGSGGDPGLAQTTIRGDALVSLLGNCPDASSDQCLFIYVANNGSFGVAKKGGNGGAATVVATSALDPKQIDMNDILVAAGGGGGGQGFDSANTKFSCYFEVTCNGGKGGVAIAIDEQNRIGTRLSDQLPTGGGIDEIYNYANALPPTFNNAAWLGGAASKGEDGTIGIKGSDNFSFAGSPAAGSLTVGTWVRENAALTLGNVFVIGGNGVSRGGAGGGGVAGGGGSGDLGGGGGGASYAVGSHYGLTSQETFNVPCDIEGFCAQNWLSTADTDQPKVVITFWQNTEAAPIVPADGGTVDTDQPSLTFLGENAGAPTQGIYYVLKNTLTGNVNLSGLINTSATGNLLWTVPAGILDSGQTYEWYTTDQAGNTLQDTRSFTVATNSVSSGLTQGWTLYVRSMDTLDGLSADLMPLSNQPVPAVSTSCSCTCSQNLLTAPNNVLPQTPTLVNSDYPSCSGYISNHSMCDCDYSANGANPTDSNFWVWKQATGDGCTSTSGNCYANAVIHPGTIDIDWSSTTNPFGLQVPPRLINVTSEPFSPGAGTSVPSLTVPAIDGFSGNCTDTSKVELTFTSQTNGGLRFFVYADPATGALSSSPITAIINWNIPSCSWKSSTQNIGSSQSDQIFPNSYMDSQVYIDCQSTLAEQSGPLSFCLTPGLSYRVRFDAVVPYLPGPMRLGFKLSGMATSAPIPSNWISTCSLDGTTQNCSAVVSEVNSSANGLKNFGLKVSGHPGTGFTHHARSDRKLNRLREKNNKSSGKRRHHKRKRVVDATGANIDTGTQGADSCTGSGSSVTCVWTKNGTWQLPSLFTEPGSYLVIQGRGGKGGVGYPASNIGGQGGQAQTVVPAETLEGETLYFYVGANGSDIAFDTCNNSTVSDGCIKDSPAGGAASLVATTPIADDFVAANNCHGDPDNLSLLVIAGGGGAGGINGGVSTAASYGGTGGSAVGGSGVQNAIGMGYAGTADDSIHYVTDETGGPFNGSQVPVLLAYPGQPAMFGNNPFDGTQTITGGIGSSDFNSAGGAIAFAGSSSELATTWVNNTSFLTLPVHSKNNNGCSGGIGGASGGGAGGYAGGGGGNSYVDSNRNTAEWQWAYGAGGGGGSSWARSAGGTLPSEYTSGWIPLISNEQSSQIIVQANCPDCFLLNSCAMENSSARPVMRCIFTNSSPSLSLTDFNTAISELIGQSIGNEVPVYLESWGGHGGKGGDALSPRNYGYGGSGGSPGYARTSHTFGDLLNLTRTLSIYVGANGSDGAGHSVNGGSAYGTPGSGAAASLVLTSNLNANLSDADIFVIAAGGGGGGQARSEDEAYNGRQGDNGGSAIATVSNWVSAGGNGPASANGNGKGACNVNDVTPAEKIHCGTDGIGGKGGGASGGSNITNWIGTSPNWSLGQGGYSQAGLTDGGAGGGGYGGGKAGIYEGIGAGDGGGAGGSYAGQATIDDSSAPVLGEANPPTTGSGVVVLSLDVCSTYPTLSVCE